MSTKYTTPAQDAARIRQTLKGCGINSRQVSVRARSYSMGSSIDVTINDPAVDIREVRNVAQAAEKIDRDQATGEILCGGNRFLSVAYGTKAAETLAAQAAALIAEVQAKALELPASAQGTGLTLSNGMILMRRDGYCFDLIAEGSPCARGAYLADRMSPVDVAAAMLGLRGGRQ